MLTLELDTANDAFAMDRGAEIARIFEELAARARAGDILDGVALIDFNGNTVGSVTDDALASEDGDR